MDTASSDAVSEPVATRWRATTGLCLLALWLGWTAPALWQQHSTTPVFCKATTK